VRLIEDGKELAALKKFPKFQAEGHTFALIGLIQALNKPLPVAQQEAYEKERDKHFEEYADLMLSDKINIFHESPSALKCAEAVAKYLENKPKGKEKADKIRGKAKMSRLGNPEEENIHERMEKNSTRVLPA
jgi:hypothetical protein